MSFQIANRGKRPSVSFPVSAYMSLASYNDFSICTFDLLCCPFSCDYPHFGPHNITSTCPPSGCVHANVNVHVLAGACACAIVCVYACVHASVRVCTQMNVICTYFFIHACVCNCTRVHTCCLFVTGNEDTY